MGQGFINISKTEKGKFPIALHQPQAEHPPLAVQILEVE